MSPPPAWSAVQRARRLRKQLHHNLARVAVRAAGLRQRLERLEEPQLPAAASACAAALARLEEISHLLEGVAAPAGRHA